jgi:hypothetical protein
MQVVDEGESDLVIACVNVDVEQMPSSQTEVHHDEPKLFVHLDNKEGEGHMRWILDSGATNHMTGEHGLVMGR